MAVQAILGAFLAALGSMIMLVGLLALLCRNLAVAVEIAYQRLSANPQAAVLLQGFSLLSASNARNMRNIKSPAMRGGGDIAKVKKQCKNSDISCRGYPFAGLL